MNRQSVATGVVHKVPNDLREVLISSASVLEKWNSLTPLARNEWICWVEEAKQLETRKRRIGRTKTELLEGMRRPCCWLGCIHRTDKEISPSIKYILSKRSKSK